VATATGFQSLQPSAPDGAVEDITSQVLVIPPPFQGGFLFGDLPVVSPPANFLVALRATLRLPACLACPRERTMGKMDFQMVALKR